MAVPRSPCLSWANTLLRWVSWGLVLGGFAIASIPLAWQASTNAIAKSAAEDALASWDASVAVERRGGNWHGSPSTVRERVAQPSGRFLLEIPTLGIRRVFPDRADQQTLRTFGLGHIAWSSWPEEEGTVAIAGHRTTYGAPFFPLDHLRTGDLIHLTMRSRTYTYVVTEKVRVPPDQATVLQSLPGSRRLALITCDPPYSTKYRLVVFGEMIAGNGE